jgi:hypothetical protein
MLPLVPTVGILGAICDDLDAIGIGLRIWRWKRRFLSEDISNITLPGSFLFLHPL